MCITLPSSTPVMYAKLNRIITYQYETIYLFKLPFENITMYEAILKLQCTRPEIIKQSLEPDIKNDEVVETTLTVENGNLKIVIKSKKLNYLKAVINSYISTVNMLEEVDKIE